jgi:hypothetical protein
MLALAAAALTAAQAPPAAATDEGHYRCEVWGNEDGLASLSAQYYGNGSEALTFGTWSSPGGAGQVRLSIHWQFMLGNVRPYSAYVSITVPLRRKASGTRLLTLTRDDAATRGLMTLGAPAAGGGRAAIAAVDLQTLLDYAGEEGDLTWRLVRPEANRGTIESGWLGLPRLKAAMKRFDRLLDELNAKRADFRNRCTYSPDAIVDD